MTGRDEVRDVVGWLGEEVLVVSSTWMEMMMCVGWAEIAWKRAVRSVVGRRGGVYMLSSSRRRD